MSWFFVRFSKIRWDVIVPFVDIGGGLLTFPGLIFLFIRLCPESYLRYELTLLISVHENRLFHMAVRIFFFILKVANIRCFILIAVEIFHNIIRK
jgi:hypothetical protein